MLDGLIDTGADAILASDLLAEQLELDLDANDGETTYAVGGRTVTARYKTVELRLHPAEVRALCSARERARAARNWGEVDAAGAAIGFVLSGVGERGAGADESRAGGSDGSEASCCRLVAPLGSDRHQFSPETPSPANCCRLVAARATDGHHFAPIPPRAPIPPPRLYAPHGATKNAAREEWIGKARSLVVIAERPRTLERVETLATALAFDRSLRTRGARRTVVLAEGVVILHDDLRDVYHLNSVTLDAPLPRGLDAEGIVGLAERWLGHLRHRHVVLDDAAAAEAVAAHFTRAGWSMQRTLFMALREEPNRPARSGVAREIDVATLRALELRLAKEDPPLGAGPAFAPRLVAAMDVLRDATCARGFAAGHNGALASACTLFLEHGGGGTALVDNVGTLRAQRRRGLARAAVAAAIDLARAEGCDPIVIPADFDDWPKELYARMGFVPLGVQVSFTLARAG
ncbi:MAG: retroviral-like aspartic protease family protein [Actinomycetota bacterium]|nr:retroviral-like aspartic protease family protein [Actinomycetota bacterium]